MRFTQPFGLVPKTKEHQSSAVFGHWLPFSDCTAGKAGAGGPKGAWPRARGTHLYLVQTNIAGCISYLVDAGLYLFGDLHVLAHISTLACVTGRNLARLHSCLQSARLGFRNLARQLGFPNLGDCTPASPPAPPLPPLPRNEDSPHQPAMRIPPSIRNGSSPPTRNENLPHRPTMRIPLSTALE